MAEVLPSAVLLEGEGSADATASVQVPEVAKQPEELEQPEPQPARGIYFVRVPRPALDETSIPKLDVELSACFKKLKSLNDKFQVKKGEANELRKQLGVARSLRNGSSPEFDEKMTRLKQLREMRKGYLDKIAEFKAGRAGLECRTEEELDEKVAEMEHAIQHNGLTLQAEKQMVKQISKLKSQREDIRKFQNAQEGLGQLEAEAKKLKAVIDEIDGEVNMLRGERDQAKDIIDDLSKKLAVVTAALDEYQAERQDIEVTKKELQEQLKGLREENDALMFEYRANRKLGVELRDLVAEGKIEDAQQMAEQQVETYLSKLKSDKEFRKEYLKLWSEQRRYLVSELLPTSGNVAAAPAAAGKGAAKGGKAAGKAGPKAAEPLVPQGAAKAQAIIAAALQEAQDTLAAKRLTEPQPQPEPEPEPSSEDVGEDGEKQPEPPARRVVPGASEELTAVRKPKAHKPVAKHVTELPEIPDYEYSLPVDVVGKQEGEQLSADELKARVREEQRQKKAEAEERKKRRLEQQAKKNAARQKATAEAAAAAAKAAKAANRAAALAAAAAAEDIDAGSGTDNDNERDEPLSGAEAGPVVVASSSQSKGGKAKGAKQLAAPAAAVNPKKVLKKPVKPLKWHQQYTKEIAGSAVAVLLLLLVVMQIFTK